jgi:mannose-1-phosphate guanylyltransferase
MKLVLLSGGSGKRLWPLSNDARSKQFLRILEDKSGQNESMVQRVWSQLMSVGLDSSTLIATSKSQVDILQNQLGLNKPLIVEPERRDTFPAVSLIASYLYSNGVNLNEVIVILPVDPYVEDHFFYKLMELENVLNSSNAEIALIGVVPTYPSSKYGYILSKENDNESVYLEVSTFIEKPNEKMAEELIEQNGLWNCGVFAFKLEYLINLLQQKGIPIQHKELIASYHELPKISFDYEVVEKANKLAVLPYDGFWKDLGTWNTLTEQMATNKIGKGIISEDSLNSHLINELDIPVTILGLSNVVVAAGPDGILVSDKRASPRIKELFSFDELPMYVERRWGWYRVLDYTKNEEGKEILVKKIVIKAGKNLSYQYHNKRSEVWTIISGEGEFILNEVMKKIKPGDILQVPIEARHAIKAITDLEFIEIQSGNELIEEDTIRIVMNWSDIIVI